MSSASVIGFSSTAGDAASSSLAPTLAVAFLAEDLGLAAFFLLAESAVVVLGVFGPASLSLVVVLGVFAGYQLLVNLQRIWYPIQN